MQAESVMPRFAFRGTTYFGWMVPIFVLFSIRAFQQHLPIQPLALFAFSLLGAGFAIPGGIQVLRLEKKDESKLKTAFGAIAACVGLIGLLELKTRGLLVWNELYFTVPALLFSVITFAACFRSEDKNFLKVYFALDGIHYIRG